MIIDHDGQHPGFRTRTQALQAPVFQPKGGYLTGQLTVRRPPEDCWNSGFPY